MGGKHKGAICEDQGTGDTAACEWSTGWGLQPTEGPRETEEKMEATPASMVSVSSHTKVLLCILPVLGCP